MIDYQVSVACPSGDPGYPTIDSRIILAQYTNNTYEALTGPTASPPAVPPLVCPFPPSTTSPSAAGPSPETAIR